MNTHCVALLYKLQNATEKVVFRTNDSNQKPKKGLTYDMGLTLMDSFAMLSFL